MEAYSSITTAIFQLEEAIKQASVALMTLKMEKKRTYAIKLKQRRNNEIEARERFLQTRKEADLPRIVELADIAPVSIFEEVTIGTQVPLEVANQLLLESFNIGKQEHNKAEMKSRLNSLREGDILNTGDYRGTGFYYVYRNPKDKKLWLKATEGESGYYLPREALSILHKFHLQFLEDIEQVYPHDVMGINLGSSKVQEYYTFPLFYSRENDENSFYLENHSLV